ncbi:MAG: DUF4445 domain-containing protein [Candidatus Omnitrophica bacterium]|nr:DUF4445 domain-containing protein [Candidatus Omnitrophota bacterium]
MKKFRVTFYPANKSIDVTQGTTILSAALSCGVYINSVCAGEGTCGKCKVLVSGKTKEKESILACQTAVNENTTVEVPLETSLDLDSRIDITLQEKAITPSCKHLGVALDIGTTTVSARLIDLDNKKGLGTAITYNRQASFGADVITRIIYTAQKDGLDKLHNAVISTINRIIGSLALEFKISPSEITSVSCAGNTTMIHLLLKIDPAYIRQGAKIPLTNSMPLQKAQKAGIGINKDGSLYCIPSVANYIGGDAVSGILSSGLYKAKELSILIDIGTNGEIAVGNEEFIVACAASAGPAFEGSGLQCGMRASPGAIEKININPKDFSLTHKTILNAKPLGICGSGYISLLSAMLTSGIIDRAGKITAQKNERIRKAEYGQEFIVAPKEETQTENDIVITEADIENLKRTKAAIYSAVALLIKHMNFKISDIKNVFISGGLGTSLDIESAVGIGLLPDLERERFFFLGNSSLAGAERVLLSSQEKDLAEAIGKKVTYFDLSSEPKYMDEYMAALFFPHTDLSKFPSLKK